MFHTGLSTLITYNPWAVSEAATLDELVHMLQEMGFHHWPVVDGDRRLLGVVSELDIVRAIEERSALMLAGAAACSPPDWRAPSVSEIMSRSVVAIDHRDTPQVALSLLLEHRIHSLPVLENNRLVGMLTSSDFLREISYGDAPFCREPVRDHMLKGAEPVDAEASLDEAEEALLYAAAEYVPVVQGDFPLGVVSRRDLRKARCRQSVRELLGAEAAPGPITLGQLVASAPTLLPGQRLAEAASLLHERALQAVAVVNHANRLLGVLSEDELLRAALATA